MKKNKIFVLIMVLSLLSIPLQVEANKEVNFISETQEEGDGDTENTESEEESEDTNASIDPYADIPYVDGETSLGLQVIEELVETVISFEVPLYVTAVVVDLEEEVLTPNNYYISNFTVDKYGSILDVAVVGISATAHSTKDYWNFIDGPISQNNQMKLTMGGVPIVVDSDQPVDLDLSNSVFYDSSSNQFTPISYGHTLNIPIVGEVKRALRANADMEKAVAQFRLCYTVSLLDDDAPIGTLYEGPYPEGYLPN